MTCKARIISGVRNSSLQKTKTWLTSFTREFWLYLDLASFLGIDRTVLCDKLYTQYQIRHIFKPLTISNKWHVQQRLIKFQCYIHFRFKISLYISTIFFFRNQEQNSSMSYGGVSLLFPNLDLQCWIMTKIFFRYWLTMQIICCASIRTEILQTFRFFFLQYGFSKNVQAFTFDDMPTWTNN